MMDGVRLQRLLTLAFWALLVAVAVLSLLPGERLPKFSASIWDKAQHAGAYIALSALGLWAHGRSGGAHGWRVVLGLLVFGVAIEFAQAATGWRHGDVRDAVANAVGVALGWACTRMARRWWAH